MFGFPAASYLRRPGDLCGQGLSSGRRRFDSKLGRLFLGVARMIGSTCLDDSVAIG